MKNKLLSIWIGCGSVLCSYTSCSKEMEFIDSPNEQVTIQLTTTIDGQGFSTDNEIIPMKTRSTRSTDYYVTAIYDSRLVIIKETGQSAWSIEKIEDNVIPISNPPMHVSIPCRQHFVREITNSCYSLTVRKTKHYTYIKVFRKRMYHG